MKLSIAAGLVLLGVSINASPAPAGGKTIAPLYISAEAEAVANSYIIVFKNHVNDSRVEEHTSWVGSLCSNHSADMYDTSLRPDKHGIRHVYSLPTLRGYAGNFHSDILEMIRHSDDVDFVEADSVVHTSELQRNAPWGLARISHQERLSDVTLNQYEYKPDGGKDIKVYVIDTGINIAHADFEGRALWGKTIPDGDADEDGNGHGSHCAGTIAGARFGVAKKAIPVAVKVLKSNGSGTNSDVLRGVDWATQEHLKEAQAAKAAGKVYKGAVANMSLGGSKSRSLDIAVNAAVDAGIVFAVAAGNENEDACNSSPSGAEKVITVGATTITDERAEFSNFGPCVDVFAPGVNIQSVWRGGNHATNIISGTSMASPHVAGLAAYFLGETKQGASAKEITDKIIQTSTKNKLKKIPADTVNRIIYNGGAGNKL
ncbi:serine protease 1 [Dichotomocladium elegans]|nr:serine protease 1 [Dichotomocladium elegans]